MIVAAALAIFAVAGFGISRWDASPPADLRIVINIPASRLDVFEHGELTRSYPISAGRREFATPAGKYRVTQLIWNPWWHPPKSEWARGEKPHPPGPTNPMGRVKINFHELYYVHGTPHEDELGIPASHGCVRIGDEDLLELTKLIHEYRTPRVEDEVLQKLQANRTMTRSFRFKPISFEVAYNVVEVHDGRLIIHPDVYRKAGSDLRSELMATLKQQGISLPERALERLSKRRIATRVTVSLDSLNSAMAGD